LRVPDPTGLPRTIFSLTLAGAPDVCMAFRKAFGIDQENGS
jgi:hypothetical protein